MKSQISMESNVFCKNVAILKKNHHMLTSGRENYSKCTRQYLKIIDQTKTCRKNEKKHAWKAENAKIRNLFA